MDMEYLISKNNEMFIKVTDKARQPRPGPATTSGKLASLVARNTKEYIGKEIRFELWGGEI